MKKPLRILHVENSERDVTLLSRHLREAGYQLVSERVETADDMSAALAASEWDIILCNYSMPRFDALSALNVLRKSGLDLPFLIISETIGEDVAVKALLNGANDYILKDNLTRLKPSIERELLQAEERRAKRKTEDALKASEAELRALFAAIDDIVIVFDYDGRHLKVAPTNPEHSFKHGTNDRIGKTVDEIYPPDFAHFLLTNIQTCLDESRTLNLEYSLSIEGNDRWFNGTVTPVTDDSAVWVARDNTERKHAEDDLRNAQKVLFESEERYRDLVENATDIIFTHDLDGNYTSVNRVAELLTGFTKDEILAMNIADAIPAEAVEIAKSIIAAKLAGEEAPNHEVELRTKDGLGVMVEVNSRIIYEDGIPIGVQGIARDITERLRAEEALRESETRLRTIIATEPECVKLIASDGSLLEMNPAGLQMIEADSFDEVSQQNIYGLVAKQDRKAFHDLTKKVFRGESGTLEFQIVGLKGTQRWLDTHASPLLDASGNITALLGITRDITESKRVTEALRESNEKFHQLADNLSDVFWIRSRDMSKIHYISPAYEKIWGRSLRSDYADPQEWQGYIVPDDQQRVKDAYASLMDDAPNIEVEFRIVRPDDEIRWVRARGFQVRDIEGNIIRLAGIVTDITESRHSNEALAESEKRFRSVVETAPDVIVTIDDENRIYFINPAAEKIFGYTVDELKGASLTMLMPERLRHRHEAGFQRYLQSGVKHVSWNRVEVTGLHKSGREIPITISFSEYVQDGRRYFTGIIRDISDRKQAMEALQKSEERYRELVENALDIIYTHDLKGNYTSANKAAETITGYTNAEALALNMAETIRPGQVEKARKMIAAKLAGENVTAYELELIAKDGHTVPIEVNTRIIYENGVAVGIQGIARDITERKAAEAALKAAEENYRSIFENAVEGICQTTLEGRFISANPATARILGFDSPEELIALRDIGSQHYVDPAIRVALLALLEEHGILAAYEAEVYKKDGSKIWTQENMRAIRGTDGQIHHYEGSIEDITARKSLEDQLRQSQKMEAIGVMAGGIAHDFNNLLTAINGYSDLTLSAMSPDDPLRRNIEEIQRAGERAAELTSQLLAFSRKQVLKPVVHNLNSVIETIEKLLRRIIPENIELRTVLDADLGNIMADPGQIEQVIMNLAVNARDAMPDGGTLTIETQNVYLDHKYMSHKLAIEPGPFVRMTVSDTGTGMDASTQQHIFEPFFTTKEVGKGTGLGLSMVYGIVKQSGGDVLVYSEPGHGTTFKIYLPRVDKTVEKPKWIGDRTASHVGTDTVLLVEDEEVVRNLVREILTGKGYNVLEASSGDAALAICKSHSGPIHLLLTDVIMPRMGGREVKEEVVKLHPDIKVLFMSGYTDDSISHGGIFDSATEFIEKPFTPDGLIDKVRGVLEQ